MRLWTNLRYAARQLGKAPAFTITVLATLGLCIGANTEIYSVVDAVFFRPLPYPNPDRLVMIANVYQHNGASGTETGQTGRIWELVRDHASSLDSAVYGGNGGVCSQPAASNTSSSSASARTSFMYSVSLRSSAANSRGKRMCPAVHRSPFSAMPFGNASFMAIRQ